MQIPPLIRSLGRRKRPATDTPPPIYLISSSGLPNFGDEFITRAWLDWLAEHHPEREVWLDCIEPGRAAHFFRDTHPRLKTTNTLWQTAHREDWPDLEALSTRMDQLVRELGSPRTDLGLRDLRGMGSLHLLGGGYLNTLWEKNLGIVALVTAVRRHFGVPVFATGQGLLPHEEQSREWMRAQLVQFDYIESRDRWGAEAFDVAHGTDDAFLAFVNSRPIYADPESLPDSMVLVQGDMFGSDRDAELSAAVKAFVGDASRRSVGFAEAIPPDDARFAGPHLGGDVAFYPFMRMWDDGFPAKPGQTWLTSRFHFHLLAAAAGASGAVVDALPGYYDIKHGLLDELGTGWSLVDPAQVDGIGVATLDASFPARVEQIARGKADVAHRLYPAKA